MLVSHTTICYHKWVPFQLGSRVIDLAVKNVPDKELRSLSLSWKLTYVGTVLSKPSQVGNKEFDLSQVKGNVVITKSDHPHFPNNSCKRTHKSHWTSQACSHVGGTIPQVSKHFCSRQYHRIKTRWISGGCGSLKFIWEGSYHGTPHQSWHDFSCQ